MDDRHFLEEHLQAATEAAKEAGFLLLSSLAGSTEINYKGEIDLVTDVDRASEEYLLNKLSTGFPQHSIMTEESGGYEGTSLFTWVIDPLDGTTNYAHGFPFFCVSIALAGNKQPLLGVVFDPVKNELFTTMRGYGASLNGRQLRVSNTKTLNESLLATGFPYDIRRGGETNLENFAAFAVRSQAVRRAGSAALDLCYTAAGRFDGYWELKLHPWDMAAGVLMVQEAGGRVTDFTAAPYDLDTTQLLATNGMIHQEMLEVISEAGRKRSNP